MGSAQYPTIKNVKVSGTVLGNGVEVGGLAGSFLDATMENCYSDVRVQSSASSVGGLVGDCNRAIIKKSVSVGVVVGYNSVGGLVGTVFDSSIVDVYSAGSVFSQVASGALVCRLDGESSVVNSFSVATINGEGSMFRWITRFSFR